MLCYPAGNQRNFGLSLSPC
ncbi:MAG: hypothetical protein DMG88_03635 [Acidobacteria bacterium]|nr:MAG: hypothetical protein DMG88_03635 [Acidobacteriota bacterium]